MDYLPPCRIALLVIFFLAASYSLADAEYISYNTDAGFVAGKINVHLVPHSHDDVGWLKTVDQYYVGSNNSIQGACVRNVLDSVVSALRDDNNRRFIFVEQAFFQRWWKQQSDSVKKIVKGLISSGQLELINGGMCMHDEAAPHYIDMIDQTTLGHLFIKKEFGQTPRIGWQIDPFGHSAVQAYLLSAEVGFDALYFSRIDYQDRDKRKDLKNLEVVWRGSKTLGSSADVFTGIFPVNYEPPPGGFYFELNDVSPVIQDDPLLFDYNVQERVDDFVFAAISQANITRTNHIMFTMGTDFKYQYANSWFKQMDKFIHYVNQDGRVNALYSTPSIYTDAKYAANETWPLKTDDFFPYADGPNRYWTGYYSSRPAFKRYVRMMSAYYIAARQLEFLKKRNSSGPTTDSLADALAIAQHHDAVAGTEQQHVANDYAKRLSIGYTKAEKIVGLSLGCLTEPLSSSTCYNPTTKFEQCPLLNISYCPSSEAELSHGKSLVVLVYNSLGWKREDVIRIPVVSDLVIVQDSSNGREIECQFLPIADTAMRLRNQYVKAYLGLSPSATPKFWLAFPVSVPPLGFSTYIISTAAKRGSGTMSALYLSNTSNIDNMEIGPGDLKLLYKVDTEDLSYYSNRRNYVKSSLGQSYKYYIGAVGDNDDLQASGAYVFRPNGTSPIKSKQVPLTIMRGPLLDEVHKQVNPWIYQITRVYKAKEHVEFEFLVGPIPIEDGIGKELATQFTTKMLTDKIFYTDSNGRDFIKRIRNYRSDWELQVHQPVAGNYFPINLGIYMKDDHTELSLLVDRSMGGSSIKDGQVELMLHRLPEGLTVTEEAARLWRCEGGGRLDDMVAVIVDGSLPAGAGISGQHLRVAERLLQYGNSAVCALTKIVVARSSAEAEYRSMTSVVSELTWLESLLVDFGVKLPSPIVLFCDSQTAIHIAENPVFHERTKHIEVDCHFVREKVQLRRFILRHVPSADQVSDVLTKTLPHSLYRQCLSKLDAYDLYAPACRRLLHDDGKGVAEALNETVCVNDECAGLTIQGKFYLRIDPLGEGARWRRTTGQEIYSPLLIAFTEQDGGDWVNSHMPNFSATESYCLPDNVAMITLQTLEDGSVLLRLAHLYEIRKIAETNLSANQERSEMKKRKLKWKVEGGSSSDTVVRGRRVDPSELLVELGPMEIRTFLLDF